MPTSYFRDPGQQFTGPSEFHTWQPEEGDPAANGFANLAAAFINGNVQRRQMDTEAARYSDERDYTRGRNAQADERANQELKLRGQEREDRADENEATLAERKREFDENLDRYDRSNASREKIAGVRADAQRDVAKTRAGAAAASKRGAPGTRIAPTEFKAALTQAEDEVGHPNEKDFMGNHLPMQERERRVQAIHKRLREILEKEHNVDPDTLQYRDLMDEKAAADGRARLDAPDDEGDAQKNPAGALFIGGDPVQSAAQSFMGAQPSPGPAASPRASAGSGVPQTPMSAGSAAGKPAAAAPDAQSYLSGSAGMQPAMEALGQLAVHMFGPGAFGGGSAGATVPNAGATPGTPSGRTSSLPETPVVHQARVGLRTSLFKAGVRNPADLNEINRLIDSQDPKDAALRMSMYQQHPEYIPAIKAYAQQLSGAGAAPQAEPSMDDLMAGAR